MNVFRIPSGGAPVGTLALGIDSEGTLDRRQGILDALRAGELDGGIDAIFSALLDVEGGGCDAAHTRGLGEGQTSVGDEPADLIDHLWSHRGFALAECDWHGER